MSIQKVFKFETSDGSFVYLLGKYSTDSVKILSLYVEWYNTDFAPFENFPEVSMNDFKFIESFCPIDFIDEV